jgi:murein DD-endopeptidase MepM/ murein hydrolase activator NlpD
VVVKLQCYFSKSFAELFSPSFNMKQLLVFLFSCFLFVNSTRAQYARFLFRNPLGIPMHLIANFGEVRNDHYHMGLDLRTQQRENLPVYAAAEGYVSRITIEAGGYGKCIYITHPNGYTTLYAHLNSFFPALQQFVAHQQYHDERWEQDMSFPKNRFKVGKGQYIGLSGATGAVEGPHLHFEVRDTKTGDNINPLFLGFPIQDTKAPFIYSLFLYDRNHSTYAADPTQIPLKQKKNIYTTKDSVVEIGSNKISFAISAEDIANGSGFRFGIYSAELLLDADSTTQFSFKLREFNYRDSRYVNASIDYKKWITTKKRVQHLSRLPGNQLFSEEGESNGIIELHDTLVHDVLILVTDVAANEALLKFKVRWKPELAIKDSVIESTQKLIPGQLNVVEKENISITFPPGALYDTVNFAMQPILVGVNGLPVYRLHFPIVPLHEAYTVVVTPSEEQKDSSKIVMRLSGNTPQIVKPIYNNGKYIGDFSTFGVLVLIADTVPPNITTSWKDGAVFYRNGSISFTVKDGISSVEKVRAELDGSWLMFENKGSNYNYKFDGYCSTGGHQLKITATDLVGNETVRIYNFELKEKASVKKSTKKKNGNTSKRRR